MSDFLASIAAHLDRTPSLCVCGHPSVLHAEGVGCLASPDNDGVPCPCEQYSAAEMAQWDLDHPDGEISDEEAASMAEYSATGRD
jgi:hypothetical protein